MANKTMYVLTTSWCPHCKRAKQLISDLLTEHPELRAVDLQIIDEEKEPEKMQSFFKYYYVPTVYVGEEKIFEGVPSDQLIKEAFEKAYGEDL